MYNGFYEEGDVCPECLEGVLNYSPVRNCSCHINSPCSACTHRELECDKCGFVPDEPEYIDVPIVLTEDTILSMREYKPRELDHTKIDYRIKMHTNSSQICEGVYPEGTTSEEVRRVVNGTFGGRFEYFRDGKFKYIAYTD
jgi:hypothetical protein